MYKERSMEKQFDSFYNTIQTKLIFPMKSLHSVCSLMEFEMLPVA